MTHNTAVNRTASGRRPAVPASGAFPAPRSPVPYSLGNSCKVRGMRAYGKLSTAFYDLDKPVAPPGAIAFYLEQARRSTGPVLEPMCGSGRFLVPLAAAGISVDGTDSSPEMLAACEQAVSRLGLTAALYTQGFEALSLPRLYGMSFIPAGSIGLVAKTDGLENGLRRLHGHLLPGASLLLEMILAEEIDERGEEFPARVVTDKDGSTISYECRTTPDSSSRTVAFHGLYQRHRGGEVLVEEREELTLRVHRKEEFTKLVRDCGFAKVVELVPSGNGDWLKDGGCTLLRCCA